MKKHGRIGEFVFYLFAIATGMFLSGCSMEASHNSVGTRPRRTISSILKDYEEDPLSPIPPWHAYSGVSLPRNKVGLLKCKSSLFEGCRLYILSVDGKDPSQVNWDGSRYNRWSPRKGKMVTAVELLPGQHEITFFPTGALPEPETDAFTTELNVEADGLYWSEMTVQIQKSGRLGKFVSVEGTWTVSISESERKRPAQRATASQGTISPSDIRDDNAIRASAKHYTNGQLIPEVGTAIGDVYVLANGGAFGKNETCGIRWSNGSTMYFGATVSVHNTIPIVRAGSPATVRPEGTVIKISRDQ